MSERNLLQEEKFQDIVKKMNNADGYLLCVTTLNGKMLNSFMSTDNFPKADMLKAILEYRQLAIEDMEGRKLNLPTVIPISVGKAKAKEQSI